MTNRMTIHFFCDKCGAQISKDDVRLHGYLCSTCSEIEFRSFIAEHPIANYPPLTKDHSERGDELTIAKIHQSPEPRPLYRVIEEGVAMDYRSINPRNTVIYTEDFGEALFVFESLLSKYKNPEYGTVIIERGMTNITGPKFTPVRMMEWRHKGNEWVQEIIMEKGL